MEHNRFVYGPATEISVVIALSNACNIYDKEREVISGILVVTLRVKLVN